MWIYIHCLVYLPVLSAVRSSDLGIRFSKLHIITCDEICTDTFHQINPIIIQARKCNCANWRANKSRIPIDDEDLRNNINNEVESNELYYESYLSSSGDGEFRDDEVNLGDDEFDPNNILPDLERSSSLAHLF